MMDNKVKDYLPGQYVGKESETTESVIADDEAAAIALFHAAVERLQDINNWHKLCGFLSTAFTLADYSGDPLSGKPSIGNFIRINIPGPGTKTGRGYDWVRIEKIRHIVLDPHQELFFIQVRPAPYPLSRENEVAHFFRDSATSSFMLVRELRQVTAAVYGRNEVPNTALSDIVDRIRNEVIANTGAIGLSIM
ncbi:MAG: hypothetical protein ABUT20_54655, partial [Bacteroidota bacterium]